MKTIERQLSQYASYHRDRRNIATHFIGIPLIVLAVVIVLSRPTVHWVGFAVTPAMLAALIAAGYYVRLDGRLGTVITILLGAAVWSGAWAAEQPTAVWLSLGMGGFIVGWVLQFVGHAWEGRKPAFVDDVVGLIIGPMFVVAEAAFLLGMRADLRHAVETRADIIQEAASTHTSA